MFSPDPDPTKPDQGPDLKPWFQYIINFFKTYLQHFSRKVDVVMRFLALIPQTFRKSPRVQRHKFCAHLCVRSKSIRFRYMFAANCFPPKIYFKKIHMNSWFFIVQNMSFYRKMAKFFCLATYFHD